MYSKIDPRLNISPGKPTVVQMSSQQFIMSLRKRIQQSLMSQTPYNDDNYPRRGITDNDSRLTTHQDMKQFSRHYCRQTKQAKFNKRFYRKKSVHLILSDSTLRLWTSRQWQLTNGIPAVQALVPPCEIFCNQYSGKRVVKKVYYAVAPYYCLPDLI